MYYPYLDKGFINYIDEQKELANPLFIKIRNNQKHHNLAIEYNYEKDTFQLGSFIGFSHRIESHPIYTAHNQYKTFESCLIKQNTLFESTDPSLLLKHLQK